MTDHLHGPGLAALLICESLLLALKERSILDSADITDLLEDAKVAQVEAASQADLEEHAHNAALALIDRIIERQV